MAPATQEPLSGCPLGTTARLRSSASCPAGFDAMRFLPGGTTRKRAASGDKLSSGSRGARGAPRDHGIVALLGCDLGLDDRGDDHRAAIEGLAEIALQVTLDESLDDAPVGALLRRCGLDAT